VCDFGGAVFPVHASKGKIKIYLKAFTENSKRFQSPSDAGVLYVCPKQSKFKQLLKMLKYSKDGISVLAVLDKRRKKVSGLYPVKIEVVHRRIQKYYPTGKDLSEDDWARLWKGRRISKTEANIENSFHNVRNEVEYLAERGKFSFRLLSLRLGMASESLNYAMEKKMRELLDHDRINSYYRYRSTLHAIERFAGRRISYHDISSQWLQRCEAWWAGSRLCPTSINIYMKTLRTVLREALSQGIIKEAEFPFGRGRYEIPASRVRTLALTKRQIKLVMNYKGGVKKEYYRDLWLFSYLCNGINFRDMLFLKYKNVVNGEIVFVRSKTRRYSSESKIIRANMTQTMMSIIEKWGNIYSGNPETFLFKCAKGGETAADMARIVRNVISECNIALRQIASELGIPAFTTYSARHSFATILKKEGIDIHFISESLGHKSLFMTEHYLAGFEHEDRVRCSKILTDF